MYNLEKFVVVLTRKFLENFPIIYPLFRSLISMPHDEF